MLILGIDTSCDETSAAVVKDGREVLSNVISSQIELHSRFGGIVPEIASRKHTEAILYVIQSAMDEAGVNLSDLGAVAVTNRPGLIGALLVGLAVAKAITYCLKLPLVGINHLEGHIYSGFLANPEIPLPHICLIVSGGHTILAEIRSETEYELLGSTGDDAAGEAFDKVAQYLGLGFPGGPIIDRLAKEGDEEAVDFPRPMIRSEDYDFSFSGLKTAVKNFVIKAKKEGQLPRVEDIAASFQKAVVDVLVEKTIRAASERNVSAISVTGGVAANSRLRAEMASRAGEIGIPVFLPPLKLCTDNAAMIAGLAYHRYKMGEAADLDLNGYANALIGE
ncbi:TPA: tRNA (adenosine(37)-N6)-threonylcarbamoyltransferase complex transferase subunit TsaD [Candidatus Poribacteria bacterium]|nr:tRNA (adenosine(37)-N6)-threonylcarbamoyltransferase complex transferase subunit TsaD [Candidatus Poribacteria bacterium]